MFRWIKIRKSLIFLWFCVSIETRILLKNSFVKVMNINIKIMNVNKIPFDLASFLEPDADFEARIQNIGKQGEDEKPKNSIFDGFEVDPSVFDANIEKTRASTQEILSIGGVISEIWKKENIPSQPEDTLLSEFEKKFPYYAEKFQKLLTYKNLPSLEDEVQRNAKILLYILEQFQITWERKEQIKLMLKLKKTLWQIHTFEEELMYTSHISNKTSLIRTSGELKKEMEMMYHVYYYNYSHCQEEYHRVLKEKQQHHRTQIISTIDTIEYQMLGKKDEPSFVDPITKMRHKLRQKRLSRA